MGSCWSSDFGSQVTSLVPLGDENIVQEILRSLKEATRLAKVFQADLYFRSIHSILKKAWYHVESDGKYPLILTLPLNTQYVEVKS